MRNQVPRRVNVSCLHATPVVTVRWKLVKSGDCLNVIMNVFVLPKFIYTLTEQEYTTGLYKHVFARMQEQDKSSDIEQQPQVHKFVYAKYKRTDAPSLWHQQ